MRAENEHHPDLIGVKIAHLRGVGLSPCSNGCGTNPLKCGGEGGLIHDPQTGGCYCERKQTPVCIIGERVSS